jgi:hypothetical protein
MLHAIKVRTIGGEVDQFYLLLLVFKIECRVVGSMSGCIVTSDKQEGVGVSLGEMLQMETELFGAFPVIDLKQAIPQEGIH